MEATPPPPSRLHQPGHRTARLAAALAAGETLTRVLGGGRLATVLGQSLHIGGWVACGIRWEIFLYEWWPILAERRLYQRLSRMPVQIIYTSAPLSAAADVRADAAISTAACAEASSPAM